MEKVIVVATSNQHKLKEIAQIFSDYRIISMQSLGFNQEIEENGLTFQENAIIKAKTVSSALNVTALADDSGLCVDALNGAPSIYSARYSGVNGERQDKANRELLLKNLQGVDDRTAYFESCVALCFNDGRIITASGRTYGKILLSEKGNNGFGYDNIFYSDELNKGFGEATDEEKNRVSHRAKALNLLSKKLQED